MEITVSEPEKRTVTSMKVQDTFYVYLIETRLNFFLHYYHMAMIFAERQSMF